MVFAFGVLFAPMLVDGERDTHEPVAVFHLFQHIQRRKKFSAVGWRIAERLQQLAVTRQGMSCDWQFKTHAVCSAVKRAGNCRNNIKMRCCCSFMVADISSGVGVYSPQVPATL